MTKNNLKSKYKTCANMIKHIIIHILYLMNVLNKLCLDFLESEKAELRKQAASVGLLYVIGIIAFQFVFKARMRHEEETETLHMTMKQYYFCLRHRAHYHININDQRRGRQKKKKRILFSLKK